MKALFLALLCAEMGQTIHLVQKQGLALEAEADAKAQNQGKAEAEYKSDALDELIEDSLFKKKKQAPIQQEDLVDQALHAKVDPKLFQIDDNSNNNAQSQTPVAPPPSKSLVKIAEQAEKDQQIIQNHLSQYAAGQVQPEMGSSILYGAINDLDLGEAKIPEYTPPGMPGQKQTDELSDDTNTQISNEAQARGGNKYLEEAEELLKDEEKEKNNAAAQQALAQAKAAQEQEDKETEEMIGEALNSMKTSAKSTMSVAEQIKLQNDMEFVKAFGAN